MLYSLNKVIIYLTNRLPIAHLLVGSIRYVIQFYN